ncbi:spondin domain-containing protein [uncultured Ferrimonas sp.]|uniref:spondin domain-containing protein n=1 Tax=uncultured Ferrimonas sp. TaxID=432640 RepID=UPI002603742C|nr:spondin domain-containing protein [uncultured Ferrimonas sp.]
MNLKPVLLATALAAPFAHAATVDVQLTNLSQGLYFTPLLISAHDAQYQLFNVGSAASPELAAMAEGGSLDGLVTLADSISAVSAVNPAQGLLMPATSTDASLSLDGDYVLSVTAMILPSNDGFVGLNSWPIPTEPGTYTLYLNAYDAGTEANNELLLDGAGAPGMLGMPAIPGGLGGSGGTGVTTTEATPVVHIHRGSLGDSDANGGVSDINSSVHRWLNPVAKLTVTVSE